MRLREQERKSDVQRHAERIHLGQQLKQRRSGPRHVPVSAVALTPDQEAALIEAYEQIDKVYV